MRKKKVAQFRDGELIKTYNDLSSAAVEVGGQQSHISECMRNVPHRHTHKGYEWRDTDDEQSITMGETEN